MEEAMEDHNVKGSHHGECRECGEGERTPREGK
jgi:hypothetical protein